MYENHFHYNGQINGGQIQFTYYHFARPPEVPQRVRTQRINKNTSKRGYLTKYCKKMLHDMSPKALFHFS